MSRSIRFGTLLAALVLAVGIAGCGTFKTSYQAVADQSHKALRWYNSAGDDLVKKVGVVWLHNETRYSAADFETILTAQLVEQLRAESGRLIVIGPQDPSAPDILRVLPRTPEGRVDNFDLALFAQRAGLNAVVIGTLIDVRDRRQEKGLWWFKDVYDAIDITMDVEVYDSQTAAKLLDERFTRQVEADIPLVLPNQPPPTTLPAPVRDEISAMMPNLARRIADAVAVKSWVGYILEVSGQRVVLSAGADSGLKPGDVLDVFDNSRVIQGVDDVHFFVPGLKIGEIEVTAALADRVEARVVSGKVTWAGSPVMLKD